MIAACTIARDVTERRRAADELSVAHELVVEASAMKSVFVANMSHEIRTPLNGVIGMADLLLDSPLDAEQQEHARLLKSAGATLASVVNDILDFSKIEAGAMRIEHVELDLLEVVEDACDLIADSAQRKGIDVAVEFDQKLPEIVRGDAVRLRQILNNLLSNAVKFTSDGEVRITLRELGEVEGRSIVCFEVTDTGIGISDDRLQQVFQPFTQEDDSTTRRFGGTGLGLAIVKQLVEAMRGEVGVTSRRGEGSTFSFTVPLERGDASSWQGRQRERPLAGRRLLIVDDHARHRRLLVGHVSRWGLEVEAVPDAAQALDRLRDAAAHGESFDCAVLKMSMPGIGGVELAEAIQRDENFPTPALVMLTSTADQRGKAREAGIDVHVTMPLRRSRLQSALAAALWIETPRAGRDAQLDHDAPVDTSPLILIVEDNEINQIVAVSMLKRRGYRTEVAENGLKALAELGRQPYAAVLMDCQMPEMNGYDTTRELRRRERGKPSTPVIAMTAHALRGDREKCLASGMDDYLSKPIKPEDLDRLLQRWATKPLTSNPDPET